MPNLFLATTSSTSRSRGNKVDVLRVASLGNQRAKCDNVGPKFLWDFWSAIWAPLEFHQFVLAKVVRAASPMPHASVGNDGTLQKIRWKGLGGAKAEHMSEVGWNFLKLTFPEFLKSLGTLPFRNPN